MKKYKVITLYNAIGTYVNHSNNYKTARRWYEDNKKDDLVLLSIMVNEKGKVLHIFDHTKKFTYVKASNYFARKDWYL